MSVQASFAQYVSFLVRVIEELGNPFEEESQDLIVLDTKEIANPAVVQTVRNAKKIGQEQFDTFTKEYLIDSTKLIDDPIHRNKLPLFSTSTCKTSILRKAAVDLPGERCSTLLAFIYWLSDT